MSYMTGVRVDPSDLVGCYIGGNQSALVEALVHGQPAGVAELCSYRWPILWQDLAVCARAGTAWCMPQPTSPKSAVRAVRLEHDANPGKVQALVDLLPVWRAALTACQLDKIQDLKSGGRLRRFTRDEWELFQPQRFGLSARQRNSVQNQVDQALAAWQAAAVLEGRKLISRDLAAGLLTGEALDTAIELYRA